MPTSVESEKTREFQKDIYFCFIDYAKAFDRVDHNKLWKILKEMGKILKELSTEELMLLNCGVGELFRGPWTAERSNQSILKDISPEYSLEGLMLKLKLRCVGHLM